jgi:hypothetical protein
MMEIELVFDKLMELIAGQSEIKTQIADMQADILTNTKLLRGNGVKGLVQDMASVKGDIADLKASIPDELICRGQLKTIKTRVEDYPSYLWLLRYKPKSTIGITLAVLFIGFVIVSPLVDHGMFAALLSWIGVPAAVIKTLVGST